MMILRAITLSLAILLPRIFLVPVFFILYAFAGLGISIVVAILSMISPFIAIIVAVLLGLSLAMIPMMIGMRLGFSARRHTVTGTYSGLVLPSMIYGLIEGIGFLLITVIASVIFTVFSSESSFAELGSSLASGNVDVIEGALESGDTTAFVLFFLSLIAISALRAALLVPLAGAAAGRDANGQFHTPLVGFGTGFVPLTILVCLSYLALPLLVMAAFSIPALFGQGTAVDSVIGNIDSFDQGGGLSSIGWTEVLVLAAAWIGWIWIFCLQCAGGVLYFLRAHSEFADHQIRTPAVPHMAQEDTRALWKSRMNKD